MATFEQALKGKRARERVAFSDLDGQDWECDLRIMDAEDPMWVVAAASDEARRRKQEPKLGNEVYDFARDVFTVLRTAVDPESPLDAPRPFFQSAKQMLESLDRDRVHYLAIRQRALQNRVSPLRHELTPAEYEAAIKLCAEPALEGGPPSPLLDMAPPLVEVLVRTMARQLLILRQFSSASSMPDSTSTSPPTSGSPSGSA